MNLLTFPRIITRPVGVGGAGGGLEYSGVVPAITPAMGSDILAGWDFTSGWTKVLGTETINSPTSFTSGGATGGLTKNVSFALGSWYRYVIAGTGTVSTLKSVNNNGSSTPLIRDNMGTATFLRDGAGAQYASLYLRQSTPSATITLSSLTAEPITFASMLSSLLVTRTSKDGTFICHPTLAANSQAGMVINYADANNFVLAIFNRITGQPELYKCLSGTYTLVRTGVGAYSAEAELKVVASGGSYSLYYNGLAIGAAVAIAEATLGTKFYGFNALAGNTVGAAQTSP